MRRTCVCVFLSDLIERISLWKGGSWRTAWRGSRRARPIVTLRKGGLTKEQLVPLVEEGLTLRGIAERLDRGVGTVRHWMRQYDLKTVRRRHHAPVGNPGRARMRCRAHGLTEFVLEGRGYYRCVACRARAVAKRRRTVKRTLVKEAGGRCVLCRYNRCQQALHFHHIDPTTKAFHLGDKGHARALERSRHEANKCVLLAATATPRWRPA